MQKEKSIREEGMQKYNHCLCNKNEKNAFVIDSYKLRIVCMVTCHVSQRILRHSSYVAGRKVFGNENIPAKNDYFNSL